MDLKRILRLGSSKKLLVWDTFRCNTTSQTEITIKQTRIIPLPSSRLHVPENAVGSGAEREVCKDDDSLSESKWSEIESEWSGSYTSLEQPNSPRNKQICFL